MDSAVPGALADLPPSRSSWGSEALRGFLRRTPSSPQLSKRSSGGGSPFLREKQEGVPFGGSNSGIWDVFLKRKMRTIRGLLGGSTSVLFFFGSLRNCYSLVGEMTSIGHIFVLPSRL